MEKAEDAKEPLDFLPFFVDVNLDEGMVEDGLPICKFCRTHFGEFTCFFVNVGFWSTVTKNGPEKSRIYFKKW